MLTPEEQLVRLLACAIYKLGTPLEISRELVDKMPPTRLVLDTETDPLVIKLSISSQEILVGTVDKDQVSVVL